MIDPHDFVVGPNATVSDIDLDVEVVHLPDGTRLTEAKAEQLAAERDHLLDTLFHDNGGEGLRAFLEKRAPRFS